MTAIVSQLSGRDAPRPTMTGASGYASFDFGSHGQIYYQVKWICQKKKKINIYDNEKQKILILIYRFGSLLWQPFFLYTEFKNYCEDE